MPRSICGLLTRAAAAFAEDGIIPTDLALELAAEGYDLAALEGDLEQRQLG